jgi:hypothetical protein
MPYQGGASKTIDKHVDYPASSSANRSTKAINPLDDLD